MEPSGVENTLADSHTTSIANLRDTVREVYVSKSVSSPCKRPRTGDGVEKVQKVKKVNQVLLLIR